ncbi:MAG TPA: cytochrome c [Acidobacteriaceae bacterium]|nr:cytochrome c [Acidobacteriaceae bacterium]
MRIPAQVILACLAALSAGCERMPGYPPEPVARPSQISDFATLYSQNCSGCHGANGQNGPAMDLANPEYQALVDDATLRKWISGGMPGTEMPAFARSAGGMLTDAQVNALVAGMRARWLPSGFSAGPTPPPYAPMHPGDAMRGEQTYRARCSACHAPSSQEITSPDYLARVGDQALRSIIIAGRPDIGQPDWQHLGPGGKAAPPLSPQDVDDIVAYLASLRGPAPAAQNAMSSPAQPAPATPTRR